MGLVFLSAFLFYFSFPNRIQMHGFWPCIWFFAVPLLLALQGQSLKRRLLYGSVWGLCAYGLMAQGLITISWVGFCAFILGLSIQSVIFAALYPCWISSGVCCVYRAVLWGASECVRNYLLGGFSFYISHAHAFCPWMLSSYGFLGCAAMSFVIFAVNSFLFEAIIAPQKRWVAGALAGVLFLAVASVGFFQPPCLKAKGYRFRVGIVQPNISVLEKIDADRFDHNVLLHLRLTQEAYAYGHPQLIIWPETAFPDDLLQDALWRSRIFKQALQMRTAILLGIAPIVNAKEYNSALLINAEGQWGGLYHKQALVPFAENMPLEKWGMPWGRGYHFSAGNVAGIFVIKPEALCFGVVICSESAHPDMAWQLRRSGARFIVELSNDGWFTDKASIMLHAQAAVMRAVENHVWVIRATNTGFSFVVDPRGVIHTDRNLQLGREGFGIFDIMIRDA